MDRSERQQISPRDSQAHRRSFRKSNLPVFGPDQRDIHSRAGGLSRNSPGCGGFGATPVRRTRLPVRPCPKVGTARAYLVSGRRPALSVRSPARRSGWNAQYDPPRRRETATAVGNRAGGLLRWPPPDGSGGATAFASRTAASRCCRIAERCAGGGVRSLGSGCSTAGFRIVGEWSRGPRRPVPPTRGEPADNDSDHKVRPPNA